MATKKATKKAAGGDATADAGEEARTVLYVDNRPYSAGETPVVLKARVKREHEDDENVLDLIVETPGAADREVKGVRRSERREPGTWHEEPEEAK